MAKRKQAFEENSPGDFFVDQSCINCGTCYHSCPEVFKESQGHSYVYQQPSQSIELELAHRALVACPTQSIGSEDVEGIKKAAHQFPIEITDRVYWCGYTSEKSFGAWSYFILRQGENILIDSPRASEPLIKELEGLGGVHHIFLSHKDDIADHDVFAKRFAAQRWVQEREGLKFAENTISSTEMIEWKPDLKIIPTPGHTEGSQCLLLEDRVLFTGDHLWWSPKLQRLSASKSYCWYDWKEQLKSLEKLCEYDFKIVLPGHGAPLFASSPKEMKKELKKAIKILKES